VTFTNHFVTTPICCPSRVSLQRGQLSPNTNFTDVLGPHGGSAKFRALDLDREWLPTWLQKAGYTTLYTGLIYLRPDTVGGAEWSGTATTAQNDPGVSGKPAWLRARDPLTAANVTFLEEIHRVPLRCMRAVDERWSWR
ncbi:hypothetical protein VaNZ11_011030, partial [Volvox africanus]